MKPKFDESIFSGALPSIASLLLDAFERNGLTRKVQSVNAWDNALAAAMHDIRKEYLKLMQSAYTVNEIIDNINKRSETEGASWLEMN